jgi:hypothetical protein
MANSAMTPPPSHRTRVRRLPERGNYDSETINKIIDETLICHVGLVNDDGPLVIPMIHARVGETIYLHGSAASRLLRAADSTPLCLTFTLVDGLVLARSVFHHSMNYRSAVVFGEGRRVTEAKEVTLALKAITDHVQKGRWEAARLPNDKELKQTTVVAVAIDEASAKIRTGPPVDDPIDVDSQVWAGVVPITSVQGEPEADPGLAEGIPLPRYLRPDNGEQ